jgi:hypothetical protein
MGRIGGDDMTEINMTEHIDDILQSAAFKADNLHNIALNALSEREFATFFQLIDEKHIVMNDALTTCDMHRHGNRIRKCKHDVNNQHDSHERIYIDTLDGLCR